VDTDAATRDALAARDGDQAAAARFVRATQADVWRLVAHLGGREAADDLTQETYLRAFRALPRFAGRSSARTWLLVIARRACADHIRAAIRERRLRPAQAPWGLSAARPAASGPHPDGPAGSPSLARPDLVTPDIGDGVALRALLAGLEPARLEAFVLTQLIGLSYAEAAQVSGCPVGTVRSRVARAREDLVGFIHPAPAQAQRG
jgi:RNA polymerase sigma-70 factor (ECF subfamily)